MPLRTKATLLPDQGHDTNAYPLLRTSGAAGSSVSLMFAEALRHAGLGERYVELLEPWREMLALGLTTRPERQEPAHSDTHAWSAHPNYGLFTTVLGIRSLVPGFKSVLVAPHPGPLGDRRAAKTGARPLRSAHSSPSLRDAHTGDHSLGNPRLR